MRKILTALAVATLLLANGALARVWVTSTDAYDCKITCSEAGYATPYTDFYKDTQRKFYICSADVAEEGERAGFSLSHEPGCFVAHEGTQVQAMQFSCMCG